MATEIFMSCTYTSVVRGTATGLLFLPSPHLSAEAFQEIPPTQARGGVTQPHWALSPTQEPPGIASYHKPSGAVHVGPAFPLSPPLLVSMFLSLRAGLDTLGCGYLCPH